jgi:hypothetical protein
MTHQPSVLHTESIFTGIFARERPLRFVYLLDDFCTNVVLRQFYDQSLRYLERNPGKGLSLETAFNIGLNTVTQWTPFHIQEVTLQLRTQCPMIDDDYLYTVKEYARQSCEGDLDDNHDSNEPQTIELRSPRFQTFFSQFLFLYTRQPIVKDARTLLSPEKYTVERKIAVIDSIRGALQSTVTWQLGNQKPEPSSTHRRDTTKPLPDKVEKKVEKKRKPIQAVKNTPPRENKHEYLVEFSEAEKTHRELNHSKLRPLNWSEPGEKTRVYSGEPKAKQQDVEFSSQRRNRSEFPLSVKRTTDDDDDDWDYDKLPPSEKKNGEIKRYDETKQDDSSHKRHRSEFPLSVKRTDEDYEELQPPSERRNEKKPSEMRNEKRTNDDQFHLDDQVHFSEPKRHQNEVLSDKRHQNELSSSQSQTFSSQRKSFDHKKVVKDQESPSFLKSPKQSSVILQLPQSIS